MIVERGNGGQAMHAAHTECKWIREKERPPRCSIWYTSTTAVDPELTAAAAERPRVLEAGTRESYLKVEEARIVVSP